MHKQTQHNFKNFAFVSQQSAKASKLVDELKQVFTFCQPDEADAIIVIGGDGELLHSMHKYMHLNIPFYGINCGSIGFLMNSPHINDARQNIDTALTTHLHLLEMIAEDHDGTIHKALAINEVSIFRKTSQACKIQITVDGVERMPELISDGVLVSTPAGSSAYNLSAGGLIVPLGANILCLTPICPFRPRRWNGALLRSSSHIQFNILEYDKRKVSTVADFREFTNIKSVSIKSINNKSIQLLFDKHHNFEDRIIKEQFHN